MNRLIFVSMAIVCSLSLSTATFGNEVAFTAAVSDNKLEWGPCPAFFSAGCQIAVLHGDPLQPNAVAYFKVPGGYEIPAHWHTSAERMVLVSGEMEVIYAGQEPLRLSTGMYAYGPAKAIHNGRCSSDQECILLIVFDGPVDAHEYIQ